MFGLGAAIAGRVDVRGYVLGQTMVTAAQVTAHYVNEYADVVPDRSIEHRTWFSGGSGVLVDGRLEPTVALRAAMVTSAIAVVTAVVLSQRAPLAAVLGVIALAVSWLYSMPPVRLLGTGLGELATSAVVAGLVPTIGLLSQGGQILVGLWWSVAVLLPLHMAMMLAFEIPDLASDARAGKRVLAVRIGATHTRRLISAMLMAATLVGGVGWAFGALPPAVAVTIPLAAVLLAALRTERYHLLTASAVAAFVLAGAGLTIGWMAN